jgi:cobalamin synthase
VLLAPAAAASVAAVAWQVLLLAGLTADGGWIWVVSLVLSGVVAIVVCRVVATSRRRRDGDLLARLMRG